MDKLVAAIIMNIAIELDEQLRRTQFVRSKGL